MFVPPESFFDKKDKPYHSKMGAEIAYQVASGKRLVHRFSKRYELAPLPGALSFYFRQYSIEKCQFQ